MSAQTRSNHPCRFNEAEARLPRRTSTLMVIQSGARRFNEAETRSPRRTVRKVFSSMVVDKLQ